MNMDFLAQHRNQTKQLGGQMADQDSSSTQSTGQSHQMSGTSEGKLHEQCVSAQAGIVSINVTCFSVQDDSYLC